MLPELEVAIGALGVAGGAAGWLAHHSSKLSRVEQKLDDHIDAQKISFAQFQEELTQIKSNLPNGEIEEILSIVKELKAKR